MGLIWWGEAPKSLHRFTRENPHAQFIWRVGTKDAPSRGLPLCHGSARQPPVDHQTNWYSSISLLKLAASREPRPTKLASHFSRITSHFSRRCQRRQRSVG